MASLTAHLRHPGDHGRLPFHPECPLCCHDRLAGPLPPDAIVGRRTQALLAAGVLALSTATPTAVLAAEPDLEQEGATAPDQAGAQAPSSTPAADPRVDVPADAAPDQAAAQAPQNTAAYDPGGDSTDLPIDAAPSAPPDVPADDDGLIEQEEATADDAPVVDSGEGTGVPAPAQQPAPPAQEVAPAPPAPAPEPSVSSPEPATPTPDPPTADKPAGQPPSDKDATRPRRGRESARPGDSTPSDSAPAASTPAASAPDSSAPSTVVVAQPQPEAQSSSGTASRGQAAQPGDRVHVVAPGESLWSIAADLVGEGASVARTAREVNRLWELNRSRIATGDPDLLMAGTRLQLR